LLTRGASRRREILERAKVACQNPRVHRAHANPTPGSWPTEAERCNSQVLSWIRCIRKLRADVALPRKQDLDPF
jgi:hypothetical protein